MSRSRLIGPIGTAARVAGAIAAIALPIALSGITWWDVGAALVALPVLAIVVTPAVDAAQRRYGAGRARASAAAAWIRNLLAVAIVLGIGTAATFLTPVDGTAIWAFVGISLFVSAARGDAGCEVIAIPNALTGRRDPVGCVVYAAIDALEKPPCD